MTSFADAIAISPRRATDTSAEYGATVPDDWAQGRTAFGGLAAALLVRAAEGLSRLEALPVRSVDTAFIGPLPPGPATVRAEVLRSGKYLTHVRAELAAEGCPELAASAHVVFGNQRTSRLAVAAPPPARKPVDDCISLPYLAGITPEFTRNMEIRFASDFPFSGSRTPELAGYCRHPDPVGGVAALAGLVDAWPGAVVTMLDGPAPASSVRWALHRPYDHDVAGAEWHWYEAETVVAAGGHATITARLYRDDRLVAWSEQLMAVFDKPRS